MESTRCQVTSKSCYWNL